MDEIPVDKIDPSNRLSPFDIEVAAVLMNDYYFNSAKFADQPVPAGGHFRTIWECSDGRFVTYLHNWATGMGYMIFARAYCKKFKQPLPSWAFRMPPSICLRLSQIALGADQLLPAACPQAGTGGAMFVRFAALTEGAKEFRSA